MTRFSPVPLRVATALAVAVSALALSACESRTSEGESGAEDSPVAAARDFMIDGVVDHNGFQACSYLTAEQQTAVARRGGGGECRQAFDNARLKLGRHRVQTVHQVEELQAKLATAGKRARVRLARNGHGTELRLTKADLSEQQEFDPPDTDWRIAAGALALIPNATRR